MDSFKTFVLASPFISAGLASFLTYFFGTKAKRKEYLYQNRLESFKLIAQKISELKKYCIGQISTIEGNEFSPFYDQQGSGLSHRKEIADSVLYNQFFLSRRSREALDILLNNMSMICNDEAQQSNQNSYSVHSISIYKSTLNQADICLEFLYDELELD